MMGVPVIGPTYAQGDNQCVICNTQQLELILSKKSNPIRYQAIMESVAIYEMLTVHVHTTQNVADLGVWFIPGGQKRNHLVGKLMYDIAD